MVDGDFFDMVEEVARAVKRTTAPFGGLQLVLCGDFHQLPPVVKGREAEANRRFCFESCAWTSCIDHCLELTEVYRQVRVAPHMSHLPGLGRCTERLCAKRLPVRQWLGLWREPPPRDQQCCSLTSDGPAMDAE